MRNFTISILGLLCVFNTLTAQIFHNNLPDFLTDMAGNTLTTEDFETAIPTQTVYPRFTISSINTLMTQVGGTRWGTDPASASLQQFQVGVPDDGTITVTFTLSVSAVGFAISLGDMHDQYNDLRNTAFEIWEGNPATGILIWRSEENFWLAGGTGVATNLAPFGGTQTVGNDEHAFFSFSSATAFTEVTIVLFDHYDMIGPAFDKDHFVIDDVIVAELPVLLDVDLTSFDAEYKNEAVQLEWTAITDSDLDQFVIERSIDGENFEELEVIYATGNTKTGYMYTDEYLPNAPTLYYRLKIVEYDLDEKYSEIKAVDVDLNISLDVSVYPNPVVDYVNIESNGSEIELIHVIDQNGSVVREIQPGGATASVEMTAFASGTYMMNIYSGDVVMTERIVKY